jgi:nicotinamidase-related amidase
MLKKEDTILIIVDVQGKLAQLMYEREKLYLNLQKIIQGATILKLPIIWMEQYPRGLGPTIPEIVSLIPDLQPIPKMSFSCCGESHFMTKLNAIDRNQILISGIETHVCIHQTALDLIEMEYEVQIVSDAVSSRSKENKEIGLKKIAASGAKLTSVEMALFELLRIAGTEEFKAISKILK